MVDENIDELSMKDTTDLMPSIRFCIMIVDTMQASATMKMLTLGTLVLGKLYHCVY